MYKKVAKGLGLGLAFTTLLFGLFFCMNNDRANSLTNTKEDKGKMTSAKSLGRAFVEVAKKVQPAVVNITTEKTITMKPWDRYGEDFFKGSPFKIFSEALAHLERKERNSGKNREAVDRGSLSIKRAIF